MSFDRLVLLSAAAILPFVALSYGAAPYGFSNDLYGLTVDNVNDAMILRGVMGLLLGTCALYARGFFDPAYRRPALLTLGYFMSGLVFGRVIGLVFDGMPAPLYLFYLVVELIWAVSAFVALSRRGEAG